MCAVIGENSEDDDPPTETSPLVQVIKVLKYKTIYSHTTYVIFNFSCCVLVLKEGNISNSSIFILKWLTLNNFTQINLTQY